MTAGVPKQKREQAAALAQRLFVDGTSTRPGPTRLEELLRNFSRFNKMQRTANHVTDVLGPKFKQNVHFQATTI